MPDDLLGALILRAYEYLGGGRPTVVAAEVDSPAGQVSGADLMPESLSSLVARSVAGESWADAVMDELTNGPVLGLPPWGRLAQRTASESPLRQAHEQLLIDVRPRDRPSLLGFLIPSGTLTAESGAPFRRLFRSTWHPKLILYSTGGLRGVHPSLTVAFVLASPTDGSAPTKFFQLPPSDKEPAQAIHEDFHRLLKRSGGRSAHGYVRRSLPTPDASLAFDRLDPEVDEQRQALRGFGSTTRLGELFEPVPSMNVVAFASEFVEPETTGALRLLRGRDVLRDGTIAPPEQDSRFVGASPGSALQDGDLVIRRLHPETDRSPLVVAVLGTADLPAVADHTLIALRSRRNLTDAHWRLLLLFLASPTTRRLVHASIHSSGLMVSPSGLLDLVIPEPDAALSAAIEELTSASQQFDAWSLRAQKLLLSAFEDGSPRDARARLIEEGRDIRLKVEAAHLVDDFDSRVRTRFPYPVAYRWRTVEALASGNDLRATHEAVLETFEVLLCYSAMIAHVMARVAGVTLGATDSIKQKLASGSSGPGLGDWVAVLEEVATSRATARLPDTQPLGEIRRLLATHVTDVRRRLTERRLAQAHLRRVTHEQFATQVGEELEDLRTMLAQATFLTDLPLLCLEEVQLDTITGTTSVTYRKLMGDHPIVPYRTMTVSRTDLEAGSLYVMDSRGGLHLLRPFLVGRDCPHCNTWSTFHADRTTKGVLGIKSLEHGHALEAPEMVAPLQNVGLM